MKPTNEMERDFLSCDWGSTSLRLRWISADDEVIREVREASGIKAILDEAARRGAHTAAERAPVFAEFIRARLEALRADAPAPSRPMPLVISGMASSSVGWRELPYAKAPLPLDGTGLVTTDLEWDRPAWVGATVLVSGVATTDEMMRGEECEIIGLLAEPTWATRRDRSLVILPGTHSKHVHVESGCLTDWRTFMTGELFDVLGSHSLLRASVDPSAVRGGDPLTTESLAPFREGVRWSQQHPLAEGLFRVRTRAVLDGKSGTENAWFFSGLLIGAELAAIGSAGNFPVIIASSSRRLAELYAAALECLAVPGLDWLCCPSEQVERAVARAHRMVLNARAQKPAR